MTSSRIDARFSLPLCVALLSGCAATPGLHCASHEAQSISDALYLGTATPNGTVAADEFATFVSEVVTPRFPQGFSVAAAHGQWRGVDGTTVREGTHVLSVVHADDAQSDASIVAIAAEYKRRFQQEAVLRVRTAVCASL
jgi:uncharacterized protein DUF3574